MGQFLNVDAVGIPWYRRGDYPRILAVMDDRELLPLTFDEWHQRAKQAVALGEREGRTVVRVEIRPEAFAAWCKARSLNVDAEARMLFAGDPANWPAGSKH